MSTWVVGDSIVDLHIKLEEMHAGSWHTSAVEPLLHDCQNLQVLYIKAYLCRDDAMS